MAEQAQQLVVENTGQPKVVQISPATSDEEAQGVTATEPADIFVQITPAD